MNKADIFGKVDNYFLRSIDFFRLDAIWESMLCWECGSCQPFAC